MLRNLFLGCLLTLAPVVHAQKQVYLAFYNLENLFDTIDDPHKNDNEFLPDGKNAWNTEKYQNKLANMAQVIGSMNNAKAPDIIGLCELENRLVLEDLIKNKNLNKKYSIVHFESPDERSIDNALLFNPDKFKLIHAVPYRISIDTSPHFKTRDLLLVVLESKSKARIGLLVNHFPSRSGGQVQSEHKRFRAAQVLKHVFDSLAKADPSLPVVAMGDFNDEPNDLSIDSVLGAKGDSTAVLFNPMRQIQAAGRGSYLYRGHWNMLDQFMLNKPATQSTGAIRYKAGSAEVYSQPWMLETDEKYKGAPKRTFAGSKYLNGYSDHFPVFLILEQK